VTWRDGDDWDPSNPADKALTRLLQRELRQRLVAWDPIGIAGAPEGEDEYDCLLSPLMHQLHNGADDTQIAAWLRTELRDHFGLEPSPDRERALAADLTRWWTAATGQASTN
jgi:hypothetical protein